MRNVMSADFRNVKLCSLVCTGSRVTLQELTNVTDVQYTVRHLLYYYEEFPFYAEQKFPQRILMSYFLL